MPRKYRENPASVAPFDERPIVDEELERNVDRAAVIYAQKRFVPRGHYGKGPKGYQRSDERIREDVCEALYRSYDVDASNIEVKVNDGCVYLSGEIDSRQTKKMAEDAVENVTGVQDVQNRLTFRRQEPVIRENEHGSRLS